MRNADGVRNLRKIIDDEQNLFIIVSAMGKTTNALEKVFEGLQKGDKQLSLEHVVAVGAAWQSTPQPLTPALKLPLL